MPNAQPRKQSSTMVDPGGSQADGRYVAILPRTITTSSSSSSSSIANATQSDNSNASDPLSLRHLNAHPSISTKHAYIIRRASLLQWQLGRERAGKELQLNRSRRALSKLHPKPLDMERDVLERQVQREKYERQIPGLEERLREIEEDDALIERTKDELTNAVGGLDEYNVEWTLMPSLVWNLMQLG